MSMFQTKAMLVEALITANVTIAELRSRNAQLAAHFDWLAAHVNELKLERAALFDRCLGLQLHAVPEIAREPLPRELAGADAGYVPNVGKVGHIGDILEKARELVDERRRPGADRDSRVGAEMAGISFEDMGDDAAKRAGITHAPDGTVVHS
jgi:hypothetical protein